MSTYALIGITGNVGGRAALKLLESGARVRAVVRSEEKGTPWKAKGAEVAVAEIDDAMALQKAFTGVDGAFVMTPTWFASEDMFAENRKAISTLGKALRAAAVPKVVFLSSIGAHRPHGTGAILKLHEMEQALGDLSSLTSLRAGWFMENYLGMIAYAKESGVLPSLLDHLDRPISMIATSDIGDQVARLLQENWSGQRIVELEAPERYSPNDVASTLTKVLKRPVKAEVLPHEQWESTYRSWGLTIGSAKAMAEMVDGFNKEWIVFEEPSQSVRGVTGLEKFFAKAVGSCPRP